MESCEVLIVGGGPAGSSCARELVKAGIDVLIADKSDFPRDKVCAGWITPGVVETLGLDLEEYRKHYVCQDIKGFHTGILNGAETTNTFNETVSYGIRRYEFDDYLLSQSGARVKSGFSVNNIQWKSDHWLVNNLIKTKMIIGAGGHFCPIARYIGAHVGRSESTVFSKEAEIELTKDEMKRCTIKSDTPELYFFPDMSGYAWLFRKDNFVNIGVGRENVTGISKDCTEFLEFLVNHRKIPEGFVKRFKGHAYLLYDHAERKCLQNNMLLIGDAAGLAYTESGEGIRPAIESGLLAAQVISRAKGQYTKRHLQTYQLLLEFRFGPKHNKVNNWLVANMRRKLGNKIVSNHYLSRHILLDHLFLRNKEQTLMEKLAPSKKTLI
jgi:flavin-dependent dehydrogenase